MRRFAIYRRRSTAPLFGTDMPDGTVVEIAGVEDDRMIVNAVDGTTAALADEEELEPLGSAGRRRMSIQDSPEEKAHNAPSSEPRAALKHSVLTIVFVLKHDGDRGDIERHVDTLLDSGALQDPIAEVTQYFDDVKHVEVVSAVCTIETDEKARCKVCGGVYATHSNATAEDPAGELCPGQAPAPPNESRNRWTEED